MTRDDVKFFIRGDGVNTPLLAAAKKEATQEGNGINPETNSSGERNTPWLAAGYFIPFFIFILPLLIILILFTIWRNGLWEEGPPPPYDPNQPTEIFLIDQYSNETSTLENEDYVIANAPHDISAIIELVEEYNKQTISVGMIKKHSIERAFYRETKYLTKNFERGAPYPVSPPFFFVDEGQQIVYHGDDLLIRFFYSQARNGMSTDFSYYYHGIEKSERRLEIKIDNIYDYFLADENSEQPGVGILE